MTQDKELRIKAVANLLAGLGEEQGWLTVLSMEKGLSQDEYQLLCDEFAQSLAERN